VSAIRREFHATAWPDAEKAPTGQAAFTEGPKMIPKMMRARIFTVLVALLISVASWLPALQSIATEVVDASLKGSLITFGSLRVLGGFISVAQGTELSAGPLIGQMTVAIGQILHPVAELVEQASAVMLLASVSLGIQKALLALCSHWVVSALITITAVAWATARIRGHSQPWADRLMLLMFLVRFLFPVMAVGSHALFDAFVAKDLRNAQQEVATAAEEAAKKRGALEMLKPSVIVEQAKATAEKVADALIRISVGFLMQTVVLPLLVLAALLYACRGFLSAASPSRRAE